MDQIAKIDDTWFNLGISATFYPLKLKYFQKMDLESFAFLFFGPNGFQLVGVRTNWHRVNGHSDVVYQNGVVVEVFLRKRLLKNWNILVNLVCSQFLKKMSGSLVLRDYELVIPMKRL